ncbi:MAG TPA: hypothetical protein VIU64_01820 [Polyangia bacterium]
MDAPQADVVVTCTAQEKLCGGACVALSDPKYGCGATTCDASTCPDPGTGGTVVCQAGACVIGTCPTGFKKCGTKCVSLTDPAYGCGAATCDATSCPAAGTGTLVCQAGACVVGTCGAGTKKCGDKCVTTDANNGCADTARCTACASNETCAGSPATCTCKPKTMAQACLNGQNCGTAPDGCGGNVSCGTCSGSTPACVNNKCACQPKTMAQACANGQNCNTASDGCGGTIPCGTCGGSTPDCVSNICTCGSGKMVCSGVCSNTSIDNAHCGNCSTACNTPNGQSCTNGKCCTKQSGRSLIPGGGFDNQATIGNWGTGSGGGGYMWTNSDDADGCSTSGSIKFTVGGGGTITYCYRTGGILSGTYYLGMKGKGSVGCNAGFNIDLAGDMPCQGSGGGAILGLVAPTGSSNWADAIPQSATAPAGANSIFIQCFEQGTGGSMDQIYLNAGSATGFGAP